jgi:cyanophycin synthetase
VACRCPKAAWWTVPNAWDAAQDIGLPVVVKPCDGNHGRGVFIDLNPGRNRNRLQGRPEEGSGVLVERFVPGLSTACWSSAASWPPPPVANRSSSSATAIHRAGPAGRTEPRPRRGLLEEHLLDPVLLDREPAAALELQRQGLTPNRCPPPAAASAAAQRQRGLDSPTGPPQRGRRRSLAARIVGLDIAGVDIVAEDISRPLPTRAAPSSRSMPAPAC